MANAYKDENGVSTMTGVTSTSGTTISRMLADPSSHGLKVSDGATGSNLGPDGRALHDENDVPTLIAVSSVDGFTPVPLYVDADGNLLIQST